MPTYPIGGHDMSEPISEAAATGAAAAVQAVQDDQHADAVVEQAAVTAEVAADAAVSAVETSAQAEGTATIAADIAVTAADTAGQAQETADTAGQVASAAAEHTLSLQELVTQEFGRVHQRLDAFEQKFAKPETPVVERVPVTTTEPKPESKDSESDRRHRFGR
jgi:hypothetical protein